jgi:hypothetical protein
MRPFTAKTAALLAATLALLVGGTVAAALVAVDSVAEAPTEQALRFDSPTPVVVIGDSAIAALRWVPGADNAVIGFEHTLDLESCRRLLLTSCTGREGRRPPTAYEAIGLQAGRYKVAMIATGYNDGSGVFEDSFIAIVQRARTLGYTQIVWWTLRSGVDYVSPGHLGTHQTFARNNALVRDLLATGDYPDVVLADWGGYSNDKPEWFVTDGVHYRSLGAWAASDYMSRKMAFLEDRSCPVPASPGQPVSDPCPDPDVTGPIADVAALYPIGEDGVLCYEIGDDRRIECRLDTHVIRITRELHFDMSGTDVSALQTRLNRLGFLGSGPTGYFGSQTRAAVQAFDASVSLPADSIADSATLAALGFDVSGIS